LSEKPIHDPRKENNGADIKDKISVLLHDENILRGKNHHKIKINSTILSEMK
jgi:hypothetical protein